jgi:glycerophosphoryl diester phosphodiesterase
MMDLQGGWNMNAFIVILLVLAGLLLLFIWAVHPDRRGREKSLIFSGNNFAHRGLWDLPRGIAENSLPAFRAAVENGYGIELDVHLTKDGRLVVFHDDTLDRICGIPGTVESKSYDELKALPLSGTALHMPLLSDVLNIVNGKVPLLIELKLPGTDCSLCERVMDLLSSYCGRYLIESFNPFALLWFRIHHPEIPRGQLSSRYSPSLGLNPLVKIASTTLVENVLSRPHFIAYNHKADNVLGLRICRRIFHAPCFAWTVRSETDARQCSSRYDAIIFEHFLPALPDRSEPSAA